MKKRYMADFETTVPLYSENFVRVWAWCIYDIDKGYIYERGIDIESFIECCIELMPCEIYFHNLKFDGGFILYYLEKNGYQWTGRRKNEHGEYRTLIADTGQYYLIEFCHEKKGKIVTCKFLDSLKKLNFPVSTIAKSFNLPISKGEIDYIKERKKGYKPSLKEWEYIENDVKIVGMALKYLFDFGRKKMTTGSDALAHYKNSLGGNKNFRKLFPVIDKSLDDFIRKAYKGGYTYLNPTHKGKDYKGCIYDANSMYPYIMYDFDLPFGDPTTFTGKPINNGMLWVASLKVKFKLKNKHLPTIQLKKSLHFLDTEYITESEPDGTNLYLTNVDFELFCSHYNIKVVEWYGGCYFKKSKDLFRFYVDEFTRSKIQSEKDGNNAMRSDSKLMLNSLYGKFGSGTERKQKIPYLDDDDIIKFEMSDSETIEPVYTAVSCFVTAYARKHLIDTAQKMFDRFIYCDTDSLHLIDYDIPDIFIDDLKLGAFKLEGYFTKCYYIRAKTYIHLIDDSLDVKCAGMPSKTKEHVTFDNFKEGETFPDKLMPKMVVGGVWLKPSEYTIKK